MTNTEERIEEIISRHLAQAQSNQYQQMDELQWLQYKRRQAKQELKQSRKRMKSTYNALTSPDTMPSGKWGLFAFALEKSVTVLQGVKMGYRIGDAIKTVFDLRNLFKRKKHGNE